MVRPGAAVTAEEISGNQNGADLLRFLRWDKRRTAQVPSARIRHSHPGNSAVTMVPDCAVISVPEPEEPVLRPAMTPDVSRNPVLPEQAAE